MKNDTDINKTTKYLWLKICIGIITTIALLYILFVVARILSVFPNIEADMTRIEGYFLFAVMCFIIGFKSLLKMNKTDQDEEFEPSAPTEEKQ